ncbi:MAG: dehydrogenase [Desulfobacterales bacterium]|nr:dehydrogenase [Desulfobacterales bacterium]
MKRIISISFGLSSEDYEFTTDFLGQQYHIKRIGTDGDVEKVANLLLEWENKVDAIGLGNVKFPSTSIPGPLQEKHIKKIATLASKIKTPITTGDSYRRVGSEWSLRHIQFKFDNSYFNNSRVLFLSGMSNYTMAKVMGEYTENLTFADPVFENGVPKFLNSLKELEIYSSNLHAFLNWIPTKRISSSAIPLKKWNDYVVKKAMQASHIIVIPYYDFFKYVEGCSMEELGGKIVITSVAYDNRVKFLQERGVDVIIDAAPKILEHVVGFNVLEALICLSLNKKPQDITNDDLLEFISDLKMDPRLIYPLGKPKRMNRFAFVIHPLSQAYLKKSEPIEMIAKYTPPAFMDTIERVMAYSPPFIYSKVTGIKSPQGVEAEGWLISIGGTPKQLLSHSPEFTYRRLLQAATMAKRLGAQVMGLGAFTKVVGDGGVKVAKISDIPITTGNSYSASGALWAAADAVRRIGLIKVVKDKKLKAKTMVIGATGSIGSVCSRLLAKAFEEVYMVDSRDAKLLALKESILEETPEVKVYISTRADKYLSEMDVIVTASSDFSNKKLDIMKVKPGCVITDVARPLELGPEDIAKRPDVLVIESGEILLPGNPEMKDIGLPPKVAFACLAETIVLALEGRFEAFTMGRNIEWEKVREIYRLGLRHGMRLAAISGVNGVITDKEIAKVRELALKKLQGVNN